MSAQANGDMSGAEFDKAGQDEVEGRTGTAKVAERRPTQAPAAGPHAEPSLTNPDATPGTGSLPAPVSDDEADAATG